MPMTCIFCQLQHESPLLETEHFYLVFDIDPIQTGHLLIIAKAHLANLTDLSNQAALELFQLQKRLIGALYNIYPDYEWTFVCNNGRLMDPGTHLHYHAIPRQTGDGFWETVSPKALDLDKASLLEALQDN